MAEQFPARYRIQAQTKHRHEADQPAVFVTVHSAAELESAKTAAKQECKENAVFAGLTVERAAPLKT